MLLKPVCQGGHRKRVWGRQRNKVEYKYSLGLLWEIFRLLLCEALMFHGEALWQVLGEALRLLYSEALWLQNGTTALLLTGAVVLLCYGDVTVQLQRKYMYFK